MMQENGFICEFGGLMAGYRPWQEVKTCHLMKYNVFLTKQCQKYGLCGINRFLMMPLIDFYA